MIKTKILKNTTFEKIWAKNSKIDVFIQFFRFQQHYIDLLKKF